MSGHVPADAISAVSGLGGTIMLFRDRIIISRTGVLHVVMDALFPHHPRIDTTIFLEDITAISVVRPMLLVEYVRFIFPGETPPHDEGYWSAAFADSSVMMNLFDNRLFYAFIARLEEMRARSGMPGPLPIRHSAHG